MTKRSRRAASAATLRHRFDNWGHTNGELVIRKYTGNKKSIEARSDDNGKTWSVKFFDSGRLTEYTGGTLQEVEELAKKHGMKLEHS
jgi:hypothetical protein